VYIFSRLAVRRYNDNICGLRVFSYPATKAVLHYKWSTWARRYLIVEMVDYLVWLIAFQAFVLLLQVTPHPGHQPIRVPLRIGCFSQDDGRRELC